MCAEHNLPERGLCVFCPGDESMVNIAIGFAPKELDKFEQAICLSCLEHIKSKCSDESYEICPSDMSLEDVVAWAKEIGVTVEHIPSNGSNNNNW